MRSAKSHVEASTQRLSVLEETAGCGAKIRKASAELKATINFTHHIYLMKKLNLLTWEISIAVS
jgi:hypothetical protein